MATWPDTLPQKFETGSTYQEKPETTALRTEMDTGIVKIRRRLTRANTEVSGMMYLTGAEVSLFVTFFQETIKGGTIAFTGALTRTGLDQTYQFLEEPTIQSLAGDFYQLNMRLLVLPV